MPVREEGMLLLYIIMDSLIILMLMLDHLSRKKLPIRRSRAFVMLMYCQFFIMGMNILVALYDRGGIEQGLLYLINYLYYFLFLLRAFFFYRYFVLCMSLRDEQTYWATLFGVLVWLLSLWILFSNLYHGKIFYFEEEKFRMGALGQLLFVQTLIYVLSDSVILLLQKRMLSAFQFMNSALYLLTLILGSLVRLSMDRNLAMGLFGVVAIAMLYLTFENPNIFLNGKTNLFNEESLETTLNEWILRQDFSLLAFQLKRHYENIEIYGRRQMELAIFEISGYLLREYPQTYIFYSDGRFVLMTDRRMELEKAAGKIWQRFGLGWKAGESELYLSTAMVAAEGACGMRSGEEMTRCLWSVLAKREEHSFSMEKLRLSDEDIAVFQREKHIKKLLKSAAKDGSITMFLQPIVDSKNHELVGAEALMRLLDEDGSVIGPAEFITVSEENGLINIIGRQILERACIFGRKYGKALGLQWINVNLSPVQCLDPRLPEKFKAITERYEIAPSRIHLEITEEASGDRKSLSEFMDSMSQAGFYFSLDDYGSGYANISRIKDYPFSNIKLDKGLVWQHFKSPDVILPAAVSAFREMQYLITAEGVETMEMARELEEMGVAYLQGFCFSRPLSEEEFLQKYLKVECVSEGWGE